MDLERDFKELLELLNSHKVEYLLVGAYALAFHGAPRFTGDLDSQRYVERVERRTSESGPRCRSLSGLTTVHTD